MKFYRHQKREHVVADKGKVVLFAALLKAKAFQHNEEALRVDPLVGRVFNLFSPPEIELAIADANRLESSVVVLDASAHENAAEEAADLAALRLKAAQRDLDKSAAKTKAAEDAVKVAAAGKKIAAPAPPPKPATTTKPATAPN